MEKPISKIQLKQFVAGKSSEEETAAINRFLQQPEGVKLFNELLADTWADLEEVDQPRRFTRSFFYKAAVWATMIVGIGAYGGFRLLNKTKAVKSDLTIMEVQENPIGQRSSFMLADSSVIYLGAGSKLFYPRKFASNRREVRLEGEAYFEVTKNPSRPFIILTGTVRTQVLGTSFKINAFSGKPVSVAVATGKVRVDLQAAHQPLKSLAILTPGQKVTYAAAGKVITSAVAIADVQSWKRGKLVFNAEKLEQLTEELARCYGVKISIRKPELKRIPVSVTLDANVPLNQLLRGLAILGNFHYTIKDKEVVIM